MEVRFFNYLLEDMVNCVGQVHELHKGITDEKAAHCIE